MKKKEKRDNHKAYTLKVNDNDFEKVTSSYGAIYP